MYTDTVLNGAMNALEIGICDNHMYVRKRV
jgi:hypothetical protein